jgi:hypothetical protein
MHAVRCPWSTEHSSHSKIDSTVLFEPAKDGLGDLWRFKCQHSTCAERRIGDVYRLFKAEGER